MMSSKNNQSTPIYRRLEEPLDLSCIKSLDKDDIQLVWIDRHWQNDDVGPLLKTIDSSAQFFDNFTTAIEYLSTKEHSLHIFIIVSGEFSMEMIRLSNHLSQIHSIFVYCSNLEKYQYLKEESLKVVAICNKASELISSIENSSKYAYTVTSRQSSIRNLNTDLVTFVWFNLLKRLLSDLTNENEGLARNDFVEVIKDHYQNNQESYAKILTEFESNIEDEVYDPRMAIYLYSLPASFSNVINEALRRQDIELLYKCRYFIRELSEALKESRQDLPANLRVYRGAVVSKENFRKFQNVARQKPFVSTFGYFSTSKNSAIAERFADKEKNVNNGEGVSIMFIIDVCSDSNAIAVDISKISGFPEEEEVLFDIDSVFKIEKEEFDEEKQIYRVWMQTSTHGNELTRDYLRFNETELDRLSAKYLFGRLIADMGEFDKSINYFKGLLDKTDIDQSLVHIHLGRVYALKGDFDTAYKYFNQARQLEIIEDSPKLTEIIFNLGCLENFFGKYESAIESYRRSLECYDRNQGADLWQMKAALHTNIAMAQTALGHFDEAEKELDHSDKCLKKANLPSGHPDFAQHQMNLAKIHQSHGDYREAKNCCQNALEISKTALSSGHPNVGKILYRLGSIIGEEGTDYEAALTCFREALVITERALGEIHPQTILIRSGIANVYLCRNECELALEHQNKVLELYENIYKNTNHEDIGRTLNNIGETHRRLKNYEQAFFYLNKSLEMRIRILGNDHFDVGTVHVNLAETYRDIKDYPTALQHAEKGVELWKRKLSPSATYMKEGQELIDELRILISQNGVTSTND